jgi:hypothetical protein
MFAYIVLGRAVVDGGAGFSGMRREIEEICDPTAADLPPRLFSGLRDVATSIAHFVSLEVRTIHTL